MTRFPYSLAPNQPNSLMARLSLTLFNMDRSVNVVGLVDSGAALNVMPYEIGLALGANWEDQFVEVPLTGALGRLEARVLFVRAIVPQAISRDPVDLAFAWARAENIPLILGQTNFFMEFDLCFYRSEGAFEVNRHEV